METKRNFSGQERDWIGPADETKHLTYIGQSDTCQKHWYFVSDQLTLDPDYSEFSVRIYDPKARSLSWVYRTLAILPKSRLRSIVSLLQEYLNSEDERSNGKS